MISERIENESFLMLCRFLTSDVVVFAGSGRVPLGDAWLHPPTVSGNMVKAQKSSGRQSAHSHRPQVADSRPHGWFIQAAVHSVCLCCDVR